MRYSKMPHPPHSHTRGWCYRDAKQQHFHLARAISKQHHARTNKKNKKTNTHTNTHSAAKKTETIRRELDGRHTTPSKLNSQRQANKRVLQAQCRSIDATQQPKHHPLPTIHYNEHTAASHRNGTRPHQHHTNDNATLQFHHSKEGRKEGRNERSQRSIEGIEGRRNERQNAGLNERTNERSQRSVEGRRSKERRIPEINQRH